MSSFLVNHYRAGALFANGRFDDWDEANEFFVERASSMKKGDKVVFVATRGKNVSPIKTARKNK